MQRRSLPPQGGQVCSVGPRRPAASIVPGTRTSRHSISWWSASTRRASTELSRGLRSGLRGALPGAVWFLATDHRHGDRQVSGVRRSQTRLRPGAVLKVPTRDVRGVFLSRALCLSELPRETRLGERRARAQPPTPEGSAAPPRTPSAREARKRWAALIKQVCETDPLTCPK